MARPRDVDIDRRLLDATAELLREGGYPNLTMGAVAARAGVSKPSLYRRFGSKAQLVFEYLTTIAVPPELPDTGDFVSDVTMAAMALAAAVNTSARPAFADRVNEMIVNEDFAVEVRARIMDPTLERVHVLWERAVARGEVDPDVDGRMALRDLSAIIHMRVAQLHEPPTEEVVRGIVDRWFEGAGRRRP